MKKYVILQENLFLLYIYGWVFLQSIFKIQPKTVELEKDNKFTRKTEKTMSFYSKKKLFYRIRKKSGFSITDNVI